VRRGVFLCLLLTGLARPVLAQTTIFGTVHDQTGSPLPGELVELSVPSSVARQTITGDTGEPEGGAADEHLHPALPRSVRISLTASF
jgi:hypothetical protein